MSRSAGFGEAPQQAFLRPFRAAKIASVATLALLAVSALSPKQHKKRRCVFLLRILRFLSRFHRLDCGFYNFQFFFVQSVEHGVDTLSALAAFILGRIEVLVDTGATGLTDISNIVTI